LIAGNEENMSTKNSSKYLLEQVSAKTAMLLPNSEYLVDRHDITSPDSYLRLSVSASWIPQYDSVKIQVVFEATAEQAVSLKSYLEDESTADDIDSGVGEAFEEAFAKVYPDSDGVGISSTSAKVKIVKK
jgi:hypothetical protein